MKTIVTKVLVIAVALGFSCGSAFAGVTDGAGDWKGKGASFGVDGKETGKFQIALTNTAVDEHTLETRGVVTLSDGTSQAFSQKMRDTERGFAIESEHGNGGGYCFGEGLCQSYIGTAERGVAVTIVIDGKSTMRTLVTELENGKARGFIRESLHR